MRCFQNAGKLLGCRVRVLVMALVSVQPANAWGGELHTSVLVKRPGDSFTCSASNLGGNTQQIEIVITSAGTPPEEIFRKTLSCGPGATCSIGTSPGDDRKAARCSIFFGGSSASVRGVLRTFDANDRAEAR